MKWADGAHWRLFAVLTDHMGRVIQGMVLIFLGCWMPELHAQCDIDIDQPIADTATTIVFVEISGLQLASLEDPGQGVCGVEIEFRHSYLGDIQIELISPEGHSVILVGPHTGSINPTNLTTWDVTFLPCGFPVSPDAGFNNTWSNNQDWGVFATYTGSYYPNNGCLEDFDTGLANGLWQIRIIDNDPPQAGQILSFSIIFCDNTGLECSLCSADGGEFDGGPVEICRGEIISQGDYDQIIFPDGIPDPSLYGYSFLLSDGTDVLQLNQPIATTNLPAGDYQICGLSYSLGDSMAIHDFVLDNTLPDILQNFMEEGDYCAALTENCLSLTISDQDTTDIMGEICTGGSYTLGPEAFDEPGQYAVIFQNSQGCDSLVRLNLNLADPVAIITPPGNLACNGTLMLNGSNSIGTNLDYSWTTLAGNILTNPDQAEITIDEPGFYILTVEANGCTDTASVFVTTNSAGPFAYATGGTLDCNITSLQLSGVVFPTNVTFSWSGPNGFSSTLLTPFVNTPGTYILEAIDSLGCRQSAYAVVGIDTISPDAQIATVFKDCEAGRYRLRGFPNGDGYIFSWSGPAGFSSNDRTINVSDGGIYTLTITATNGCSGTGQIIIDADYTIPDINLTPPGDTLHCGEELIFHANTGNPTDSILWTRPNGILHDSIAIIAWRPGQFMVTVYGENGCTAEESFMVHPGSDLFDLTILSDTIDCNSDTATLTVVADNIDAIEWTGPGLITNNMPTVIVNLPGVYEVVVENEAGCRQRRDVVVIEDKNRPRVSVNSDTFTCLNNSAVIWYEAINPIQSFIWEGPDNTTYTDSVISVQTPGRYVINVTGYNGCIRTFNITPPVDTVPPIFFLESDFLGCHDSIPIHIVQVDTLVSYSWTGPGGFSNSTATAYVQEMGNYTLTAVGENDCASSVTLFVDTSLFIPEVSILGEQLNCNEPDAELQGMVNSSSLDLQWQDGAGNLLGTDPTLLISLPGMYYLSASGEDVCSVTDSFEVIPLADPSILLSPDSIDCYDNALIGASSDMDGSIFTWTGPGGFTSDQDSILVGESGLYTLSVEGPNGCISDTTLNVPIDTLPPLAIGIAEGILRCASRDVYLNGEMSVGQELEFLWMTSNGGNIVSGDSTVLAIADLPGEYNLLVTDLSNGCQSTDTVFVEEQANPLETIYFSIVAECDNNGNGSLTIDSVAAADTPLSFTLNGSIPQGSSVFAQLDGGSYLLTVEDSFGCVLDTMVSIPDVDGDFFADLGADIEIYIGDTAHLLINTNLDTSQIAQTTWTPLANTLCDNCLTAYYTPLETTIIHMQLLMELGCIIEDRLTINVVEKARAYIPNVFSPNNDGFNDFFEIFLMEGVSRILRLGVYDRWGNMVYGLEDAPNQPGIVQWDGRFQGRELPPAVFVYLLELELINGKKEILHGDLTLIR